MDLETNAKNEFISKLINLMVTPNVKLQNHTESDDSIYSNFIKDVSLGKDSTVQLPLDYILKDELFNLIKDNKVFVDSSVKFIVTLTNKKPDNQVGYSFEAKYVGNEFNYYFLDNHPGIININRLKDIPIDYEGLMAVPPTILEFKNIVRFNIIRVLYTPKLCGKFIYPRVVVSNKMIIH
jgi:hypothetical protein